MSNVLNVVEIIGDWDIHVSSFVFREDSVRRDEVNKRKVREAENLFIKMARDNGILPSDEEFCLESGIFEKGEYKLFLTWNEN